MVDDEDGDESPSLQPRTDSRSALPREIRAWQRLCIIKRDETFSLIFSPRDGIYGVGVEVGGASVGPRAQGGVPREEGAPPTLVDMVWPPGLDSFASIFYIFQNLPPRIFRTFRELLFSTHKTTSWQFC